MEYNTSVMGHGDQKSLTGYIGIIGSIPTGSNYIVIQGGSLDEARFNALAQEVANLVTAVSNLDDRCFEDSNSLYSRLYYAEQRINALESQLENIVSGSVSYNNLTDKPQINNVTLQGNKTTSDLHIISGGDGEIDTLYHNDNDTPIEGTTAFTVTLSKNYYDYNYIYFIIEDPDNIVYEAETENESTTVSSTISYQIDSTDTTGRSMNFTTIVGEKEITISITNGKTASFVCTGTDKLIVKKVLGATL